MERRNQAVSFKRTLGIARSDHIPDETDLVLEERVCHGRAFGLDL